MVYFSEGVIDAKHLSLTDWITHFLGNPDKIFPNNSFPSDDILNKYISQIDSRPEKEVKDIIRRLIVNSGNYGTDMYTVASVKQSGRLKELVTSSELIRRMVFQPIHWEGITWVLDLLPDDFRAALKIINNYFSVHCQALPDNAIHGMSDAATLIRARYMHHEYPQDVFLTMSPTQFELLVEHLYKRKGYSTTLTQKTRDGGRDIIAEKSRKSGVEKLVIQCKRYTNKITVKELRELSSVVQNYPLNYGERVTKGVLVCSSDFTPPARKEFSKDHSMELINHKYLSEQLNKFEGKNWPIKLEKILWGA